MTSIHPSGRIISHRDSLLLSLPPHPNTYHLLNLSPLSFLLLLDLLALAAYDHSPEASGRTVRWSITGPRRSKGLRPDTIERDPQAGWHVDRMEIERLP